MDLAAGVAAAFAVSGEAFGSAPDALPALRWGALYAELHPTASDACAIDVELIYEGYLLHYRESRTLRLPAEDPGARLLAGDCFYARGLRGIAARGDAAGVGLLARLMAACSYLRAAGAPFADDDALWAYTTAGLAAHHAGDDSASMAELFDAVEAGFSTPEPGAVRAEVASAAARLTLSDAAPLWRELDAVAGR